LTQKYQLQKWQDKNMFNNYLT